MGAIMVIYILGTYYTLSWSLYSHSNYLQRIDLWVFYPFLYWGLLLLVGRRPSVYQLRSIWRRPPKHAKVRQPHDWLYISICSLMWPWRVKRFTNISTVSNMRNRGFSRFLYETWRIHQSCGLFRYPCARNFICALWVASLKIRKWWIEGVSSNFSQVVSWFISWDEPEDGSYRAWKSSI